MTAELCGSEFNNLENGFDSERNLRGRAARRTDLARPAFGRADQAQPEACGGQHRCNLSSESRALLRFIEDMKAAAIEDEMEGPRRRRIVGKRVGENVQCLESTA